MPTPERTSREQIIRAGRDILESDGLARLTMQAVADRVGVRAPSLYKRVSGRDELIGLIADALLAELGQRLRAVAGGADVRADLGALAREYRAFAHEHPAGYQLLFARGSGVSPPDPEALAQAVAPVLEMARQLVSPHEVLPAARTFTAWAYGFVGMELAGAFNLGGDVDHAFEFGITRLADAFGAPPSKAGRRAKSRA
jgi:AcrR family transcriptional regulator